MQGVTYLNNGNSEGITDMVVTGTHVYWTRVFPNVIRVATPGQANSAGDFATLNDQPFGVTASQTHVVWSTWNLGNSDIDVCAVGATCGSVTTLATNQHLGYRPASLLIDGSDVYWTSTEWNGTRGIVSRCPLAGCNQTPTIIARVFSTGQTRPGGIVADATFVYFLMDDDNGIKLYRLVKN
jgi:hypothetical protein